MMIVGLTTRYKQKFVTTVFYKPTDTPDPSFMKESESAAFMKMSSSDSQMQISSSTDRLNDPMIT